MVTPFDAGGALSSRRRLRALARTTPLLRFPRRYSRDLSMGNRGTYCCLERAPFFFTETRFVSTETHFVSAYSICTTLHHLALLCSDFEAQVASADGSRPGVLRSLTS